MSFLLKIQRLFMPPSADDKPDAIGVPGLEDDNGVIFSQHMRILLAIVIALLSAMFMWWIVA